MVFGTAAGAAGRLSGGRAEGFAQGCPLAGAHGEKSRRLLNEIKKESGWDELEKEVRDVQHDVKDAVKQGDVSAELREAKKSVQDSAEKFDKDTKSN